MHGKAEITVEHNVDTHTIRGSYPDGTQAEITVENGKWDSSLFWDSVAGPEPSIPSGFDFDGLGDLDEAESRETSEVRESGDEHLSSADMALSRSLEAAALHDDVPNTVLENEAITLGMSDALLASETIIVKSLESDMDSHSESEITLEQQAPEEYQGAEIGYNLVSDTVISDIEMI